MVYWMLLQPFTKFNMLLTLMHNGTHSHKPTNPLCCYEIIGLTDLIINEKFLCDLTNNYSKRMFYKYQENVNIFICPYYLVKLIETWPWVGHRDQVICWVMSNFYTPEVICMTDLHYHINEWWYIYILDISFLLHNITVIYLIIVMPGIIFVITTLRHKVKNYIWLLNIHCCRWIQNQKNNINTLRLRQKAPISQMTFSNVFFGVKMYEFCSQMDLFWCKVRWALIQGQR